MIVVTIDIDWAPDFAIEFAAEKLITANIKATWFATHNSPAVTRLLDNSAQFEVGIHPNFLPGSTHGTTISEVLDHCMAMFPNATSMRSHGLYQSTPLFATVLERTPIRVDASVFCHRGRALTPTKLWWKGKALTRIPFCWEDDFEMHCPVPIWRMAKFDLNEDALQIINFHPVHIYLNSSDMKPYLSLRNQRPKLANIPRDNFDTLRQTRAGTRTFFQEALEYLATKRNSWKICELEALGTGLPSSG